jgi:SAM-dependent methyltransferase
MDTISLLGETFAPLARKHILDIGCGGGNLARALIAGGARVTGIDPAKEAIAAARRIAPDAALSVASAEALPFPDDHFDGAVFLNSLHHVPPGGMGAALDEAARVTRPGGLIVVIEPLAAGSFFSALKLIEDETEVRRQAQDALAVALVRGPLQSLRSAIFTRSEAFLGFDAFVERATAANPERRDTIARNGKAIEAAFRAHAEQDADGRYRLEQPLKGDILLRPAVPVSPERGAV